jgi:hypothetical protein
MLAGCSWEHAPTIGAHASANLLDSNVYFYEPARGNVSPDFALSVQPGGQNELDVFLSLRVALDAKANRTSRIAIDDATVSLERAADGQHLAALQLLPGNDRPAFWPLDSGATISQQIGAGSRIDDALRDALCDGLAVQLRVAPLDQALGERLDSVSAPFVVTCPPRHASASIEVIDAYFVPSDHQISGQTGAGELQVILQEQFSLGHEAREQERLILHSNLFAEPADPASVDLTSLSPTIGSSVEDVSYSTEPTPLDPGGSATVGMTWTAQLPDIAQIPWLCAGPTRFVSLVELPAASLASRGLQGFYSPTYVLRPPPFQVRCPAAAP